MKRKLVCSKCNTTVQDSSGRPRYIVGTSAALVFQPRSIICWDCDPKTDKNLIEELLAPIMPVEPKTYKKKRNPKRVAK